MFRKKKKSGSTPSISRRGTENAFEGERPDARRLTALRAPIQEVSEAAMKIELQDAIEKFGAEAMPAGNPYEAALGMLKLVMQLIGLDEQAVSRIDSTIESCQKAQINRQRAEMSSAQRERILKMKDEILKFLCLQKDTAAALRIQQFWRTRRAERHYTKMKQVYVKGRNESVIELMKRERGYVRYLETCVRSYLHPIRDTQEKNLKMATGKEYEAVFSNIGELLALHRTVVKDLEDLLKDWPSVNRFGQKLMDLAPRFRAYGTYVTNIKFAFDTLSRWQEQDVINSWLECVMLSCGADLKMLLSMPLNHVSNYEMMLTKMVDSTSPDAPDYQSLISALSIMRETSKFVSTRLGNADTRSKVLEIERRVVNLSSKVKTLAKDRREFVKEGLTEVVSGFKRPVVGRLFLFNDVVLVTIQTKEAKGSKYKLVELFELSRTKVQDEDDGLSLKMEADIAALEEGANCYLRFVTDIEIREWRTILKEGVLNNQKNRTFGVPISSIVEREKRDLKVPLVVVQLVEGLEKKGMEHQGLYRVPGTQAIVNRVKDDYNQLGAHDFDVNSLDDCSAADLAGVLKAYFFDSPDPVCTFKLCDKFINVVKKHPAPDERDKMLCALKKLVHQLPPAHYSTLKYFMAHLKRVSAFSEQNKMVTSNLAMCVSPNLLRPEVETIEYSLNIPKANGALQAMIDDWDLIFDE